MILKKIKLKKIFIKKQFIKNNKSILKAQQIFRSERHNVFTEEISVNNIALNSNAAKDCNHLIRWKHMHMKRANT